MKPTYPINYRGGWMQPATEYVPEVRKSRPTWKPNSKLPDYGPVIDEAPRPRQSFKDRAKSYQKIKYSEPFHTATPVTEFPKAQIYLYKILWMSRVGKVFRVASN